MIRKLKKEIIRIKGKRKARYYETQNEAIRIDLGSGSVKRKGFLSLDLSKNADIEWDFNWGLPFQNNRISEIRSDHCFEHLQLSSVVYILKECYRILKKEGILRFSVPHINPYLEAYYKKDKIFLSKKIFDIPDDDIGLYGTSFDIIAWLLLRNGEHKSVFDDESIVHKVKLAGFSKVSIEDYDESKDLIYRFSSIIIEAKK